MLLNIVIDKSYYQDLLLGSVPCFQFSCYLLNKNIHCEDKKTVVMRILWKESFWDDVFIVWN